MGLARSVRLQTRRRKDRERIAALSRSAHCRTSIMRKYVVTGGAGFIGSALVRGLLRQGASKVTVIDNLLSGREANLEEVRSSVDLHTVDIRCYEQVAPL